MNTRKKIWITFALVVALTVFALWVDMPGGPNINLNKIGIKPSEGKTESDLIKRLDVKLGLDLKGGAELVYQADLSSISQDSYEDAMSGVRDVIERRVNAFGVSEPSVYVSGQDRLVIELPGIKDLKAAEDAIGETPTLVFMEESEESADATPELLDEEGNAITSEITDEEGNPIDLSEYVQPQFVATNLTGKDLAKSSVVFDQTGIGSPQISLEFTAEGKDKFEQLTEKNVGKRLAIAIDGVIVSAPSVNEKIIGGNAVITGNFTLSEAKDLAINLNAGALPVPINLVQEQNIGATLGKLSVEKSVMAGIIGIISIAVFMIVYYRIPGLMAVLALVSYIAISLLIFKLIPVTLTLAGAAGFILSIGMAVDANVLIFERIKEELVGGGETRLAIESGLKGAWPSIRDSNITTLISCAVLYFLGSSVVRGFALTLGVGVMVSMFSAIIVTSAYLRVMAIRGMSAKWLWWLGVNQKKQ